MYIRRELSDKFVDMIDIYLFECDVFRCGGMCVGKHLFVCEYIRIFIILIII